MTLVLRAPLRGHASCNGFVPRQTAARKLAILTGEHEETNRMQAMHMVTAVIKPFQLDEVRDALAEIGVRGLVVTDMRGFTHQMGHTERYRGAEFVVDFLPKLRIEVAVPGSILDEVTECLGNCGDGSVYILTLRQAARIRTGEKGVAVL